jgi:hypothetical protein
MRYVLMLVAPILVAVLTYEVISAIRSHYAARWQSTLGRLKRWHIHSDIDAEHTRIVIRDLEYTYSVGGQNYESSRLGFGFPTRMGALYIENTLKGLLHRAPDVLVFFDPANPKKSALSVGVKLHHFVRILGIGLVLMIVGAVLYGEP